MRPTPRWQGALGADKVVFEQGVYLDNYGADWQMENAAKQCDSADACVLFLGLSSIQGHGGDFQAVNSAWARPGRPPPHLSSMRPARAGAERRRTRVWARAPAERAPAAFPPSHLTQTRPAATRQPRASRPEPGLGGRRRVRHTCLQAVNHPRGAAPRGGRPRARATAAADAPPAPARRAATTSTASTRRRRATTGAAWSCRACRRRLRGCWRG